jgi:hypothetical protein
MDSAPKKSPPPQPAASRESPVLFSLRELMDLERDRLAQEEHARNEALLAAQKFKEDAERRRREDERARLAAEAEREAALRARLAAETARLETLRLAAVERARVEALAEAQRVTLSFAHEHARNLEAIDADASRVRLRRTLVAVGLASLVAATALGALWRANATKGSEAEAQAAAEQARERARLDKVEQALRAKQAEVERLREEVQRTTQLASSAAVVPHVGAHPNGGHGSSPSMGPTRAPTRAPTPLPTPLKGARCACPEGDPTCYVKPDGTCAHGF